MQEQIKQVIIKMYNNFLAEKNKKVQDHQKNLDRRLNKWLHHYRSNTRPQLITAYTQRINTFISKLEQNPKQLQRFQAPDIREQKQQHLKERLSAMEMKGGRMFKFRDTTDFKSFYGSAERMQRDQNRTIFQKRFGDSRMACRSIASQSEYNPRSQFRSRDKAKQINPPMKYTNKISPCILNHRKTKSVIETRRKNQNNKTQISRHDQNDQQNFVRRSTSVSNSALGQQLTRSVTSIKADSQSSQDSYKNLKKLSVTLKDHNKLKKKQSGKTYFVGITDVKLNSKDPHLRKTLHNILVKVGKNRPNPRDKTLLSHVQVLSNQMN